MIHYWVGIIVYEIQLLGLPVTITTDLDIYLWKRELAGSVYGGRESSLFLLS